jgi:hypothetical protein
MSNFTKADRLKAEWAARVYKESGRSKTTARAIHYFALGRTDYPLFNKAGLKGIRPYVDSDDGHITEWIALAKRQGIIGWDQLPDETVSESVVEDYSCDSDFSYHYELSQPDWTEIKKYLGLEVYSREINEIDRRQPFHQELWAEKNTMNSILRPVCQKYGAVLVTFKGHCSWGSVWKLCKRVAADGRPALVFYLSDMDASGFRMAVELAEKIAEINNNFFDGKLDIRVRRIGLTPQQVIDNQIQLVDRKDTEKANNSLYEAYVGKYGLELNKKAELDALERYYPGGVAAFVEEWLKKFVDDDLERKCIDATAELIKELPANPPLPENLIDLRSKLLAGLEELISAEDAIVPENDILEGDSEGVDIEPDTTDPTEILWLLETANGVYPTGDEDVDFTAMEAV